MILHRFELAGHSVRKCGRLDAAPGSSRSVTHTCNRMRTVHAQSSATTRTHLGFLPAFQPPAHAAVLAEGPDPTSNPPPPLDIILSAITRLYALDVLYTLHATVQQRESPMLRMEVSLTLWIVLLLSWAQLEQEGEPECAIHRQAFRDVSKQANLTKATTAASYNPHCQHGRRLACRRSSIL